MTELSAREIDFSRYSDANIEALGNVAFGGKGKGVPLGRLKDLERKGLIARDMQTAHDRFGSYSWPEWFMPLSVHVQFCAWTATPEDTP